LPGPESPLLVRRLDRLSAMSQFVEVRASTSLTAIFMLLRRST